MNYLHHTQSPSRQFLRSRRRQQSGAALVEAVFGVVVLCAFAFGVVEFGYLSHDSGSLNNYARDCARDLAAGNLYTSQNGNTGTADKICNAANAVNAFEQTLTPANNIKAYYSTDQGKTFPATNAVQNDGPNGVSNSIPLGAMVKVIITINHTNKTGLFGTGPTKVSAFAIMVRQ